MVEISAVGDGGQLGHLLPQRLQPLRRQPRPAANRLVPDDGKVGKAAEVLRDGDGVVEVEDDVPPAGRHEDRLAGLLDDLQWLELCRPVGRLRSRVYHSEPGDGLVHLGATLARLHLDQLFGGVGGKEAPPLGARDEGVPGAGAQRVNVNAGAGAGAAHDEPLVRRSFVLADVLEEVVAEVNRHIVVFEDFLFAMVLQRD